jgi:hypothetical protein
MSNLANSAVRIGLSRTGVALMQTSGWMRIHCRLVAEAAWAEDELASERLAARLEGLFAEHRCTGLPASVILADEWVRLFIVTPPQNATRLLDCRAAAAMRFQALYGESAAAWQLEADWHARLPFLACAVPQALLTALRAATGQHRMTVTQIVPQFIAAWNRWRHALEPGAWFGLVQSDTLTLGAIAQQRLRAIRVARIPDSPARPTQWLFEHVGREALRLSVPVPDRLQLCGRLERHWAGTTIGSLTCEHLESDQPASNVVPLSACAMLAYTGVRQ